MPSVVARSVVVARSAVVSSIRKQNTGRRLSWNPVLTVTRIIPSRDNDPLCYCHSCKLELFCEPCDLHEDKDGPIHFVPTEK